MCLIDKSMAYFDTVDLTYRFILSSETLNKNEVLLIGSFDCLFDQISTIVGLKKSTFR